MKESNKFYLIDDSSLKIDWHADDFEEKMKEEEDRIKDRLEKRKAYLEQVGKGTPK